MPRTFRTFLVLSALMLLSVLPADAQRRTTPQRWSRDCNNDYDRDRARFCLVHESTMPASSGVLTIDGRMNGGISVIGTNRRDILIIAKIQSNARTEERAEELAGEIRIHAERGRIYAEGPDTRSREGWSVSFEVEVPLNTDLDLKANNGGIAVTDVSGVLRMQTQNGGVQLRSVAGDVLAETMNGGVDVRLEGDRWQGRGLEATTMNGGVRVLIPDNYNAHLETGTVNGGIDIDFPVTVRGRIGRRITTDLGRGGAPIRVMTTNGGVVIRRG